MNVKALLEDIATQFAHSIIRKTESAEAKTASTASRTKRTTYMVKSAGVFLALAAASAAATAAEAEWRFMGPAFSRHLSMDGAAISQPASRPGSSEMKKWVENNPAIGLMRIDRDESGMATQYFGQIVKDSYGKVGAMAGMGFSWPLFETDSFKGEWGVAAGLWYRTYAKTQDQEAWYHTINAPTQPGGFQTIDSTRVDYQVTEIKRALIPFVLPVASIEHKSSGVGVSISFVPQIKKNGKTLGPNTLLFQTTYRF